VRRWLVVLALVAPLVLIAADGTPASDPLSLLSTLGFPTVAVVLFLRGEIYSKGTVTEIRAQRDEAIAGWREQTDATNKLASAIEERNRIEELQERDRAHRERVR
jgi:hypothetical protein